MSKKRKTRQKKIILQLKRELKEKPLLPSLKTIESEASQEEVFLEPQIKFQPEKTTKISDISANLTDLKLIKKDLFKTLFITFFITSLEVVLYLKLR
ncbi:MAG: hypothetical protein NT052_01125 [Candidatus Shapirobacteria bacterium]|nr:hypothetical protein [Candidatus Shapirobacteria bacterium]